MLMMPIVLLGVTLLQPLVPISGNPYSASGVASYRLSTLSKLGKTTTHDVRGGIQTADAGGALLQFDVRAFGAKGDGHTIDSDAINRAIDAAAAAGGGTVYLGGGTFASHSIRLKSHVGLYLDQGAVLLASTGSISSDRSNRRRRRDRTPRDA